MKTKEKILKENEINKFLKETFFKKDKLISSNINIFLEGEIGTGKTTLTKSLLEMLNVKENVTSPTFTILNEYKICGQKNSEHKIPATKIYHMDLYRVSDLNEIEDVFDIYEILTSDGVKIIEWPSLIFNLISKNKELKKVIKGAVKIKIFYQKKETDNRKYFVSEI